MHFAGVYLSSTEPEADLDEILSVASDSVFTFREVTFSEVVLVVAHFSLQAKREGGIPQSVIAKSLPVTGHHLAVLFNSSLTNGIFSETW